MSKDETRYGRLVVLEKTRLPAGKWTREAAVVKCDCGQVKTVLMYNLTSGNTTSCGCFHKEVVERGRDITVTRNGVTFTRARNHGHSKTPLYRQWKAMVRRCHAPAAHNYKWYGGKGIRVCPEWREDFLAFKAWAEQHGYVRGLEIDRIESDGDYEPGNCRYRTKKANIRSRDLAWSDELDAKLVATAQARGVSPYDLIRTAVEAYLS